jgi:ubiquinone/menaquinone biosynthesis C-methylase UbiE
MTGDTSTKSRSEVYFFAQDREFAPYYDLVEDILNPYLKVTHDLVTDLVVESVKRNKTTRKGDPVILVVGSGTGSEVLLIARKLPQARIVAVDFSPLMNSQLREKFSAAFPDQEFRSRVDLLECDFLSDACTPSSMIERLQETFGTDRFDAAVIGFVTHHYSAENKRQFYERIKSVLCNEGSLIHADLFNFDSAWLSGLAHQIGEKWIVQLTDGNARCRWPKIQHIAARLQSAWVKHWNHTHMYTPLHNTQPASPGVFPNHMDALRQLGFSEIECPLRLWEVGVIWAKL